MLGWASIRPIGPPGFTNRCETTETDWCGRGCRTSQTLAWSRYAGQECSERFLQGAQEARRPWKAPPRAADDVGGVISSPPLPRPCGLPPANERPAEHLPPPCANQRSCESNAGNAALQLASATTMPPPAGAIKIPPPVQLWRRGTTDEDGDALLLPPHLPTPSSGAARFPLYLAISRHLFAGNGQKINGGSPRTRFENSRNLSASRRYVKGAVKIKYNLAQIESADFGNALSSIPAAKYAFCNQEEKKKNARNIQNRSNFALHEASRDASCSRGSSDAIEGSIQVIRSERTESRRQSTSPPPWRWRPPIAQASPRDAKETMRPKRPLLYLFPLISTLVVRRWR